MSITCEKCGKQFSQKSNLKRHAKTAHPGFIKNESPNNTKSITCEICGKQFSQTFNLKRHYKAIHPEYIVKDEPPNDSKSYTCETCGNQFSQISSLKRHTMQSHPKSTQLIKNESMRDGITFTCEKCGKKFSRKNSLKRHVESIHPDWLGNGFTENKSLFICASCSRSFNRKDILKHHIISQHLATLEKRTYECAHCSEIFKEKQTIIRHLRYTCSCLQKKKHLPILPAKCLECGQTFISRSILEDHYKSVHDINIEFEEFVFDSCDEFNQWKRNMQRQTMTQFHVRTSYKKPSYTVKWFACHRSGHYTSQATMRRTKRKGSKKLQGICPASIFVKIQNGKYFVKFQKTHVGHKICDLKEMRHLSLDLEDKQKIAKELSTGVPLTKVLEKSYLNTIPIGDDVDRTRFLQYHDLVNIRSKFRIKKQPPLSSDNEKSFVEELDVESFIIQKKDAVLYHKDQNAIDKSQRLNPEDFLIVLMDQTQEQYLQRYGNRVVSMDGTHGTDSCKFPVHTLLVLDEDQEGIPVAFAVSNRNDEIVINIFLECVRDRVGEIEPHTLITDMQRMYRNSWNKIMKPASFSLFCQWHVRRDWIQSLHSKILTREKRDSVKRTLDNILYEMNPMVFEEKLNDFFTSDDEDTREFVEYFRRTFCDEEKYSWAACYRLQAGINMNMHVKAFHELLKRNLNGCKKIQSLQEGLICLFKYLTYKDNNIIIKKVMGKRLNKLDDLNRNHDRAVTECGTKIIIIERISHNRWFVESSKDTNDISDLYVVEENDVMECALSNDGECRLFCVDCDMCFHKYRCNCYHSSIRNSMCKHIHMVGISSKQEQSVSRTTLQFQEISPSRGNSPVDVHFITIDENLSNDDALSIEEYALIENDVVSNHNVEITGAVVLQNTSAQDSLLEAEIEYTVQELRDALALACDEKQIIDVRNKYILPIKRVLLAGQTSRECGRKNETIPVNVENLNATDSFVVKKNR